MGQDGTDWKAETVRGSKASPAAQLSLLLCSTGAARVVPVPHFLLPWVSVLSPCAGTGTCVLAQWPGSGRWSSWKLICCGTQQPDHSWGWLHCANARAAGLMQENRPAPGSSSQAWTWAGMVAGRSDASCLAPALVLLLSFPWQSSLKGVFQKAGCSCQTSWVFFGWVMFFTQCRLSSTSPVDSAAARVLGHRWRRGWCAGRSEYLLLGEGGSASPLTRLVDAGFRCLLALCFMHAVFDKLSFSPRSLFPLLCSVCNSPSFLSMQFFVEPGCKLDCWAGRG